MSGDPTQIAAVVQSGYDQIAEKYLAWSENRPSPRLRYVESLLDKITTGGTNRLKLLELGCGAGVPVIKYLASHPRVGEVIGNDISTRQLELARQRVTGGHAAVTFLAGDMSSLAFEKEDLDGIAAFFSIIHLPRVAQRTTLMQIRDWLKPGGCLVCNFSAGKEGGNTQTQHQPPGEHEEGAFDGFLGVPMYWEEPDVNGSLALVQEAGLEVLGHEILDVTDGRQVLDLTDPDAGALFLWIIARKPL